MDQELNLHPALRQILNEFDLTTEKINERKVAAAIRGIVPEDSAPPSSTEWQAEAMAFDFCEDYSDKATGWGSYYGPMWVMGNGDGTANEYPSLSIITQEILDYWATRAKEATNPVLKARYADLVWDLSKPATGGTADVNMAQITIDSIRAIAEQDSHENRVYVVTKLKRALSVAISLSDTNRIEGIRDTIIAYGNKIAVDDKLGLWGFSYDQLVINSKAHLTAAQEEQIIHDLEDRLDRVSKPDESDGYPRAMEAAATRLASYYRRQNNQDDVKRVLWKYAGTFEEAAKNASPLQASAWLQTVHSVLVDYEFHEEAARIAVQLQRLGPQVNAELKPISTTTEISKKAMEEYVQAVISGDLDSALTRIAVHYVPKKEEVEQQITELAKTAPVSFLISRQILDGKGRPVATLGSLKDDFAGHIVTQVSQNLFFSSIFLRPVMAAVIRCFTLTAHKLTEYMYLSPIFEEDRRKIMERGFQAYLDGDHLVATHLLIPQLEAAIRTLIEKSGGSIYRQRRDGGFNLRPLDNVLRDPKVMDVLGENVALYFKILLTDQRGWNLRNDISHGMLAYADFGIEKTDRIVHALLCLAQVREASRA